MLIQCPECELQVSDKAVICPHCGYPLKGTIPKIQTRRTNKRRRLPNGFGQICEIKNRNLRNPFRVMITTGKDENGRPICSLLKPKAYFATYNEAYEALLSFHKNPYDSMNEISVKEVYERWFEEHKKGSSEATMKTYITAWNYCSYVYDMKITELRVHHIRKCIDEGTIIFQGEKRTPSANIKYRIKNLFNLILDYAVANEIVEKNCARGFRLTADITEESNLTKNPHITFSDEEIKTLWKHLDIEGVDVVLIQCYSGWRPQEIGLIKIEDVDIENWFFTGGMKTKAGKQRVVPIHPKIRNLVKKRYDEALRINSPYLFSGKNPNKPFSYDAYRYAFIKLMEPLSLNPEHRTHDGRVYFVTKAKQYGVDEYALKYIIGHSITDLTEKVYTRRDPAWLQEEIKKIK